MEISTKLKLFRVKLGLTQAELAEKLELNQRTYSNYERGYSSIPKPILRFLREIGFESEEDTQKETASNVDLKDLTHYQKAEIVLNDIIKRTPKDMKLDLSGNNLEVAIQQIERLSAHFDYSLKQLYEHAEALFPTHFPGLKLGKSELKRE